MFVHVGSWGGDLACMSDAGQRVIVDDDDTSPSETACASVCARMRAVA